MFLFSPAPTHCRNSKESTTRNKIPILTTDRIEEAAAAAAAAMRGNRIQIPQQMEKHPNDPRLYPTRPAGGKANLASCVLATAFLILVVIAGAATLFFLFRPKDPTIHVTAVHLPGFSVKNSNSDPNVVNGFSFSAYAAVRNPNRAAFSHYDSSIRLLSGGIQVGFMYIPAGEIGGGRTQNMESTFSVGSFPISAAGAGIGSVELDSRVELKGRVRVLKIFVHRVTVVAECRIAVSPADGAVTGVHC